MVFAKEGIKEHRTLLTRNMNSDLEPNSSDTRIEDLKSKVELTRSITAEFTKKLIESLPSMIFEWSFKQNLSRMAMREPAGPAARSLMLKSYQVHATWISFI